MAVTMSSFVDAQPTPLIAGRWQRSLAFVIDMLLVVGITTIVGFALAPVWKMAGEWARLVGLMVGMFYFGFADRLGPRVTRYLFRIAKWLGRALVSMTVLLLAAAWKIMLLCARVAGMLGARKFYPAFADRAQRSMARHRAWAAEVRFEFNFEWQLGQTFGMYLTSCKLVDLDGKRLAFPRAALRFLFFAGPLASLGSRGTGSVQVDMVLAGILAGLVAVNLYLLVFNRNNRRGLHDMLAGSVVVNEEFSSPDVEKVWRWHYLFIALVFVAGFGGTGKAIQQGTQNIDMQPELVTELSTAFPDENFSAFVQTTKREVDGRERESDYLVISVINPGEHRDLARAVEYVAIVRDKFATSGLMRRIVIRYVDRFHVGFSFFRKMDSFVYSPADWEKLIEADDRDALIAEYMEQRERRNKKRRGRTGG